MASRMKKIFHRKKDDEVEKSTIGSRPSTSARRDPAMRSSLYEDTTAGTMPQTGDYPVKGNDSSVILPKQGRQSSIRSLRSRRNSGSQHQHENSRHNPQLMTSPSSKTMSAGSHDPNLRQAGLAQDLSGLHLGGGQGPTTVTTTVTTTRFPSNTPMANRGLPQNQGSTARLNPDPVSMAVAQDPSRRAPFGDRDSSQIQRYSEQNAQGAYTDRNIPHEQGRGDQAIDFHANGRSATGQGFGNQDSQGSYANTGLASSQRYHEHNSQDAYTSKGLPQRQGYGNHIGGISAVNDNRHNEFGSGKTYPGETPLDRLTASTAHQGDEEYDQNLTRQPSIPRKRVGASANTSTPSMQTSSSANPYAGRDQSQSVPKSLPPIPRLSNGRSGDDTNGNASQTPAGQMSSVLDRARPVPSKDFLGFRNAQDVVQRAKSNTYDTEVIERVAPAVVHETVHEDIHHVREEVVTREIHTHDVYHRILPVIDVEVLPPRHFLPVEGGGLVEVSASEVPGRGQNWVIAETASKIPSDQAAPQDIRGFTARKFPGRDGDAIEYTTSEGYQKTERTWVHPPELEEGARLTGQSWPMVFGDEAPAKGTYGYSSPKSTKKKHSRTGSKNQADQVVGVSGIGRAA